MHYLQEGDLLILYRNIQGNYVMSPYPNPVILSSKQKTVLGRPLSPTSLKWC